MKKISVKGVARAEKGFTLIIFNEDLNDIIKTIKSLQVAGVLIDGVTETAKKKKEDFFGLC